jgi:dihydrofolate reductase
LTGTVGLIWAQTASGVIGRAGAIPWHLPEDLARFKALTLGHTVVMGRRTWESLPARVRPLPGRRNVVLTKQADFVAVGADVVTSVEDALRPRGSSEDDAFDLDDQVWVIGGAQIYPLALAHACRCEVTEVDLHLPREDDDAMAPMLDQGWTGEDEDWQVSRAGLRYRFSSYRRL